MTRTVQQGISSAIRAESLAVTKRLAEAARIGAAGRFEVHEGIFGGFPAVVAVGPEAVAAEYAASWAWPAMAEVARAR